MPSRLHLIISFSLHISFNYLLLERYGLDFIKFFEFIPVIWTSIANYYLHILGDKMIANYYSKKDTSSKPLVYRYSIVDGKEKEEVKNAIIEMAYKGDLDAQHFYEKNIEKDILSWFIHNLTKNEQYYSNPKVLLGLCVYHLRHLDFGNAIYYFDILANNRDRYGIIFKAILTFHGHCYKKERI